MIRRPLVSLLCVLTLCMGIGGTAWAGQASSDASGAPLQWIVVASAAAKLLDVPGAGAAVTSALDHPSTFVLGQPPAAIATWHVHWAMSAKSLADVQSILAVPDASRLSAVLYDQEHWSFTPPAEQQNPATYVQQAEAAVHRQGLLLIAAPATDLVYARGPVAPGTAYSTFVKLGIAGQIAQYADAYEIQAQGLEADVQEYQSFVDQVAAQARSANPSVVLFAGLSTNPGGQRVTAAELEADVAATRGVVSGYWLNVPSGGAYCSQCGTAQPQVGAQLLESLTGGGGSAPAGQAGSCQVATPFTDMGQACWAAQAVANLAAKGVVNGFPDGTFHPGDPVTRAEFVKMLDLVLGLTQSTGSPPFADVPSGAWYAPYVSAASVAGVVRGDGGRFDPDAPVTREQLAVLVDRALHLIAPAAPPSLGDASRIDTWAQAAVDAVVSAGYMRGLPGGVFGPLAPATRAQVAVLLDRMFSSSGTATTTSSMPAGLGTPLPPQFYGVNYDCQGAAAFQQVSVDPLLAALSPSTLRWPGGTEADYFDWNTGIDTADIGSFTFTLSDLLAAYRGTGAPPIFDLNVLAPANRTDVSDQLRMLQAPASLGLSVRYVEIGNKLYGGRGRAAFPDGTTYAKAVAL